MKQLSRYEACKICSHSSRPLRVLSVCGLEGWAETNPQACRPQTLPASLILHLFFHERNYPMTWPVPRKISLPEILKDLYKNEWDPGTSFLLFLSFSVCDPQQSSVGGEQDKGKKAFVEEGKGAISQSDSGCHFSAPVEDRTALQSSAPHQPTAGFVGTRWPKLNPAFLICTWMGWQVTQVCSCPCYVLSLFTVRAV